MRRYGHGTPIPNRSIERQNTGSGPVITYKLSDEELARYRALPAPKPRDQDGEMINRPVAQHEKPIEREKPMNDLAQESKQDEGSRTVSKTDYLRLRAAGKTHTEIEDTLRLARGTISSYWLRKWGLKGVTAEKAQELLGDQPAAEDLANDTPTIATESPEPVLGLLAFNEKTESKEREIRMLREELAQALREKEQLQLNENVLSDAYAAAVAVSNELEAERDALLRTIERATTEGAVPSDIGCYDAIGAATVGLTGIQAFLTGAIIETLWGWGNSGDASNAAILDRSRAFLDRLIAVASTNSHDLPQG